ncbi:MAG: hypothetical protein WEC59_11550 [Salibacteraceae bacterium]
MITIFLSDGIEIETNLPKELVKDSTYIVEVVIKKGSLFGFAKYQQDFPEGFDAKPVETSEASFTYADGKMKFIWMALPEVDEVKISYAVTAFDGAPAEALVEGKFSYISDNQRKSYAIPNQTIRVISDEPIEEQVPVVADVSRKVSKVKDNLFQVDLTINKQGVYGFSKLEEFLPDGAEAEVINNQKAVFSQVDDRAKFVWMSIPDDEALNISYTVKSNEDILEQLKNMEGNFAFLDENETKTVAIIGDGSTPTIADNTTSEQVEESQVEEDVAEEEVAEQTEQPDEVEEIAEAPEEVEMIKDEPVQEQTTAIPEPEGDLIYRVQIVAGHKLVDENYIQKTYKYQDGFITENHEGWIKYLAEAQFDVYKQARDKREALIAAQHNFPGPFVTAYNAGERITVQEALMITNQQWFK